MARNLSQLIAKADEEDPLEDPVPKGLLDDFGASDEPTADPEEAASMVPPEPSDTRSLIASFSPSKGTPTPPRASKVPQLAEAQRSAALTRNMGNVSDSLNAAFTRRPAPKAAQSTLADDVQAQQALGEKEQLQAKGEDEFANDRAVLGKVLGADLSGMSRAGITSLASQLGIEKKLGATRTAAKAAAEAKALEESKRRADKLSDTAVAQDFQLGRDKQSAIEAEKRARIMATAQKDKAATDATKGTNVPGLEVNPDAEPTQDDAKKVKLSMVSREKIKKYVDELTQLHAEHGTEFTGPVAGRMEQLVAAIMLEGKNIGELGAISGPDMGIMKQLTGADPTSLGANAKALVGVDNTAAALKGMQKWVDDTADAVKTSYGYHDKPRAKVKVKRLSDGKVGLINADDPALKSGQYVTVGGV